MRCTDCNYPLWNTPAGNCPECGKPFKPTTHIFKVGEVRFRCPDCEQDYFGDDFDGHLRPNHFDCVSCGRHLHEDDCLLFPAEGDMDAIADVRTPWFDSSRRWIGRWFSTIGWSLGQPGRLIDGVPRSTGLGPGLLFLCLNVLFFAAVSLGPFVVMMGLQGLAQIWGWILVPLAIFVAVFIQGSVTHWILALTGGAQESYTRTMSAATFSTGPFVLCSIPCVGVCISPLGAVWWLVAMIIMVHVGQKVSGLRAALSSLVLPAIIVGLWMGALVVSEAATARRAAPAWVNAPVDAAQAAEPVQIDNAVEALIKAYTDNNGSLLGIEWFQERAPELSGSANTHSQITEEGECWWLGNVFVYAVQGEFNLVVLVYKPDGTLMEYWKTESSMRKGGSSGMSLDRMAQDIQLTREDEGSPRIPQDLLDAWVDSQEP